MDTHFDFEEQIEKLARVPKPIRLGVVAGVLACIACGYYFLAYQPKRQEALELRAQAQELQRKLNNVRAVAANVAAFEREVADLERDLDRALEQLPNGKQFDDLLQDISTAGKQVGVEINSIEREPEVRHDFYAEVPFNLELEGGYHDLARFFEHIARLPRIVNVGSLDVRVQKERKKSTTLRIEGTATTFRFLNEKERSASLMPNGARGRA